MENPGVAHESRILFVGVRTRGSLALTAFPAWARALGLDATLETVDVPLDAPGRVYRELAVRARADRDIRGAVVTAHKARLYEHARDMFDALDPLARTCREISVLHWVGSRFVGAAIEPRSAARTLASMLPPRHWETTRGELVLYGAGGTAAAICAHLYPASEPAGDAPCRVRLVDLVPSRAERLAATVAAARSDVDVSIHGPHVSARVLADAPPGSLIVNATGLGKDRPGSPVPLPAPWPAGVVVWELNYRGERPWFEDARSAAARRQLVVHDGWDLFVHGWSEALGTIRGRPVTRAERAALTASAARFRAA
jgi:shikimate dehydrogenase